MFLTYILPTTLLLTHRDSNLSTLGQRHLAAIGPKPLPSRTLFGDVELYFDQILTVFICAWTSVHPNVPPQSRMWTISKDRVDVLDNCSTRTCPCVGCTTVVCREGSQGYFQ